MNYCTYREVMTGNYDCPYATVVNNSVVCTSKECDNSSDYYKRFYLLGDIPKPTIPVDNYLDDEDDVCLSCPYFNPEAPDCCTYAPEACYYDTEADKYPF